MKLKPCPVCGNEPMPLCYTSNPPQFGYICCKIDGGYHNDWHEAAAEWNRRVGEGEKG